MYGARAILLAYASMSRQPHYRLSRVNGGTAPIFANSRLFFVKFFAFSEKDCLRLTFAAFYIGKNISLFRYCLL